LAFILKSDVLLTFTVKINLFYLGLNAIVSIREVRFNVHLLISFKNKFHKTKAEKIDYKTE